MSTAICALRCQLGAQVGLDIVWESVLEKSRNFLPILPVSIADGEEVAVPQLQHVRIRQVCILVLLVWVVCSDAPLCRE